ncbi:hypothetical protein OVA11_10085 [Caulobacter sp. SL161]|uniref:hypothetical protein n=1 Tax=Caulobacter sp. SL161 TaxID=2995156 RepID=UPI002274B489|nr:hypothetical protein [Caulobacter sp. SL161]MCY1647389.1 hypothetical protein [Caulobacter sp. SL161]
MSASFEDALECVLKGLEHPPAHGTDEDADFMIALALVLATPPAHDEEQPMAAPAALDDDLRRRLQAVAQHRDFPNVFGDHPGGIGPTLGMDLSVKGQALRR